MTRWSARSQSSRREALLVAAAAVTAAFLVAFASPPARAASPTVPATGRVLHFTLYGNAGDGWGFNASHLTNPGPTLRAVLGDTVNLTLIATDPVTHNWFVDYDNSLQPNGNEPSSAQFGNPKPTQITFQFVPQVTGNHTYRCEIHPSSMTGFLNVTAPTGYTLYGNLTSGWGAAANHTTNPGPILVAVAGLPLTLHLYSADGVAHTWFIDYDGSKAPGAGENATQEFSNATTPYNFTFVPTQTGNETYRCGIHPLAMTGYIVIVGTAVVTPTAGIGLVPGMMLALIVIVLALAGVYQVRAVRAHRRNQ